MASELLVNTSPGNGLLPTQLKADWNNLPLVRSSAIHSRVIFIWIPKIAVKYCVWSPHFWYHSHIPQGQWINCKGSLSHMELDCTREPGDRWHIIYIAWVDIDIVLCMHSFKCNRQQLEVNISMYACFTAYICYESLVKSMPLITVNIKS